MQAKPTPPEYEEYPVTDYDFSYLGTSLSFTLVDGTDTLVWAIDPESNAPAAIIDTVTPPEHAVLFVSGMLGYRQRQRTHRRIKGRSVPQS